MYDLVIFDLDGTLVDTLEDIAASVNRGLAENGLPIHPLDAYRHFVGDGMRKLIARAAGERPEKVPAVLEYYRADYPENCLVATKPYDGIPEVLHTLVDRGVKVAIVTNKPEEQAARIVPRLFGDIPFVAVQAGCDRYPTKPDPTSTREVMSLAGVTPEKTLYVGDSDIDVHTAHNAGLVCVGVQWGFRGTKELRSVGAEHIAETAEDILTVVFGNAR